MKEREFRAQLNRLYLVSNRLVEELLGGNYRSVFRGPGIEFDEVREYTEGDDARIVDWNVTARLGNAFAKTYREERELVLFFVVDVSASVFLGEPANRRKELVQFLVALLTFCAVRNNDKIGAVFFSDRIEKWIPPRKGKEHAFRLINDVLAIEPKGKGSDLTGALRTVGKYMKRRGIVFLLSDFKTGGYSRELSLVARKHDVVAIRVYDPLDEQYPESGLVRLQDPETEEVIPGAGFLRRFRDAYLEFRQFWRRIWIRECTRRGVGILEISTQEDPGLKLIRFFEGRRKYR
jgi:uncharacterized protein (DUF58 family)